MSSYDARFEALIHFFNPRIQKECANFTWKAPFPDLYAVALKGLFYADHTHRSGEDFQQYVMKTIKAALKLHITEHFWLRHVSLNEEVTRNGHTFQRLSLLAAPSQDLDLKIMVQDFIAALPPLLGSIAKSIYFDNMGFDGICWKHQLSNEALAELLAEMRHYWITMYDPGQKTPSVFPTAR